MSDRIWPTCVKNCPPWEVYFFKILVLSIMFHLCTLAIFYYDRFQLKERINVILTGSFLTVSRGHRARSVIMNL